MRRRRKRRRTSYVILTIIAMLSIAFTIACLWLFYKYQEIPDTLVTCFYTTVVGELLVSGLIKMTKTKYERTGEENEL